jgi:hypothetical protein
MGRGRRHQVPPLPPDLAADRTGQPAQLRRLRLDIHHQVASGRIDEPGQGRERRLAPSGLISADHALHDTRPEGQFRLRHPGTDPGPPQQAPGGYICAIHKANYSGSSIIRRARCFWTEAQIHCPVSSELRRVPRERGIRMPRWPPGTESLAWFGWHRHEGRDSALYEDETVRRTVVEFICAALIPR